MGWVAKADHTIIGFCAFPKIGKVNCRQNAANLKQAHGNNHARRPAEPPTKWVVAEGLEVTFDDRHPALADLDLTCQAGEFVSIVGPSGCGKSTLLRVIAGLQPLTNGQLYLGWRQDIAGAEISAGFVFQQANLLPWRSVVDNIALPLELQGVERAARIAKAREVCQLVSLTPGDESKLPRMLSGGMQMRVAVARALVTQPKVMLMDEPFAAVDDLLRGNLNQELVALWQLHRWTTFFVTHHVQEAVFLSQRVLVMSPAPGRIVSEFKVDFSYPRSLALRGTPEFAALADSISAALRQSAS